MKIGIIMGGFSAERHISVESGRNIYEKLASSDLYTPIPIFLTGTPTRHQLFILPINILLKDSADDIHAKLRAVNLDVGDKKTIVQELQQEAAVIIHRYAGRVKNQPQEISYKELANLVDSVFIALHGRPGEDGTLQAILEAHAIPYNGSGIAASRLTMDKFNTNQFLHKHGIQVAKQLIVGKAAWQQGKAALIQALEKQFTYPLIAKPVDEGCSAAVVKIKNRAMLESYVAIAFRETVALDIAMPVLGLQPQAPFPPCERFLVEACIEQGHAQRFLEITGGFLTHYDEVGNRQYEFFEPSESVALDGILSVEEKFLAGAGQNITPARYDPDPVTNRSIGQHVKQELEKVARLLNIEGYARIDAFVKVYSLDRIEVWIIEVNALPGMTPATCIFHQCALSGYKPLDFIHLIIQYGVKRQQLKATSI
jgi:D-alanine--D-alanine ligase